MKEVQDNRGTRKTKNAIRNSLIELMGHKPITQITVTEICEKADIHRTTFYAYYDDHYDLLKQMEKEAMTNFDRLLDENKLAAHCTSREIAAMQEEALRYIADNNDSLQALLSKNGDIYFQERFIRRLTMHLHQIRKKGTGEVTDDKKNIYYSVFLVHGALAILQLWIKNKMDIPVSDIAKILRDNYILKPRGNS
jgi:AcrR family transcriptional regulator